MKAPTPIQLLLAKFLRDECSPEEVSQLIAYLQKHDDPSVLPSVPEVVSKLREHPTLSDTQADRIFQNVLAQPFSTATVRSLPLVRWAAAVGTFFLLAGLVYLWLFAADSVVYATDYGQIKAVQLPDGSTVSLNGHSQLRLTSDWNQEDDREVWLEGEAYFSVTHTARHQPFVVHISDSLRVEVLGTEFSVNSRSRAADVTLRSGKVLVKAQQPDTLYARVMQPGDQVAYQKTTQQLTQHRVDPELYMAWKDNLLLFDNTPLSEIARTLEETYGMPVQFNDKALRQLRFTGSNPADDIDLLLKTLEKSFGLHITRIDQNITINRQTP